MIVYCVRILAGCMLSPYLDNVHLSDLEFSNMGTATICGPSGSMCHGRLVSPGHVKVNVKSLCGGASVPYPWTQTIDWFTEPVMAHSFLIWPVKFLKAAGTEIE